MPLCVPFSTSSDFGNEIHKKKKTAVILVVSRKNLCLMFLPFMPVFYFHRQPAHFLHCFPFIICCLSVSLSHHISFLQATLNAKPYLSERLNPSGRANVIPYTTRCTLFATGRVWVILILCHPPTQMHSISDLI